MAELVKSLDLKRCKQALAEVEEQIATAAKRSGRSGDQVKLLVATKYVPVELMDTLAQAGVKVVGENRLQDLRTKVNQYGNQFEWHFIGHLQSKKVKQVLPLVKLIHSVCSESVLAELEKRADPQTEVLVEVNLSGEESKSGVKPSELTAFIEHCPVKVEGLMTMPPRSSSPEDSRPYFAKLRELAERHSLKELSMGTSQDYIVAVEEGATIVRVGSAIFSD